MRIALFESRLAAEITELVRRRGAVPVCVPAVRERRRCAGPELDALLTELQNENRPVFVLSTGIGVSTLFEEARSVGRDADLRDAMSRGITVCRGPKPVAALHRERVAASIKARSPYTTAEFVEAAASADLRDRTTVVVNYGERNEPLLDALTSRAARVRELTLYEWALPEDVAPLERLAEELALGRFAAAAFTSQIQARNLLTIADRSGTKARLLRAFCERVVIAAVGPTCARVLTELGIPPHVVPETPKMGAMVEALVSRLAARTA